MKKNKIFILISIIAFLYNYSFSYDFAGLFKRGLRALNDKNYREAVEYLSKALQLPEKPGKGLSLAAVYNLRGIAYTELGENDKALEDFAIAIETYPEYVEVYNNRGRVYYNLGEYDKAVENYSRAIDQDKKYLRLKEKYHEALYNKGLAFFGKGEYEKAVEDFSQVIRLNPYSEKTYFNRGDCYQSTGTSSSQRSTKEVL